MTKVFFGLLSTEGDRLGHLVRGVQMLRSYGDEAHVISYSDVVNAAFSADEPPGLCCVLECSTDATEEGLQGICKETQWALGDQDEVLRVWVLRYGNKKTADQAPEPLQALLQGKQAEGTTLFLPRTEFAKLCDWGQNLTDADTDVIGEWPSATGR